MTDSVEANRGEDITFQDADGRISQWHIKYMEAPTTTGDGLTMCRIESDTGASAVRGWVGEQVAKADGPACEALEHEVRAGVRLLDRYPEQYPAELVRLIGYNLDVAEPFVLVSPVDGKTIDELGQLRPDEREAFQISLLRGLVHLHDAGVVHGDIGPSTVYWNGRVAQLRDFGRARVTARSEEGRLTRPTLGGRDVWSAGSLILQVATGRAGLAGREALENRGQALRDLLEGVFTGNDEARPSARTLLGRLNVPVHLPPEDTAAWQRFEDGRQRFDRELRAKWPELAPPAPPPAPTPPPASRFPARWLALVVVAVVAALIVMLVVR